MEATTTEIEAPTAQEFITRLKEQATVFPEAERKKREDEYNPKKHKIFDVVYRPWRRVVSDVRQKDNTVKTEITWEDRVRIAYAAQQLIVKRRVMFVTGGGIEPNAVLDKKDEEQKRFYDIFLKTLKDNKINNRYASLAKGMMAEGEAVALFYMEDAPKGYWGDLVKGEAGRKRVRMMMRVPSDGDTYYPYFNQYRNMVGFGISYKLKENGKDVEYLDYYTDTELTRYKNDGGWVMDKPVLHGFTKIPLSYFIQIDSEWYMVQEAIERKEEMMSDLAETNIAFGSPILQAEGEIQSFVHKKDTAKILTMKDGGKAGYIETKNAPDSIKLEDEKLEDIINSITRNANTAFDRMLDIGNIATATLKLMFVDPHAAAKEHQDGHFGESVQRMFNIIKDGIRAIDNTLASYADMEIDAVFNTYLPKNETEEINNNSIQARTLLEALAGGLISLATALKFMPYVEDADEELPVLEKELKERQERQVEERVTLEI